MSTVPTMIAGSRGIVEPFAVIDMRAAERRNGECAVA